MSRPKITKHYITVARAIAAGKRTFHHRDLIVNNTSFRRIALRFGMKRIPEWCGPWTVTDKSLEFSRTVLELRSSRKSKYIRKVSHDEWMSRRANTQGLAS